MNVTHSKRLAQTTLLAILVLALLSLLGTAFAQTVSILYHADVEPLKPAIERFENDHPGVNVEIVRPAGGLTDSTIALHAAGTAPDIFVNDAGGAELPFVAQGLAIPLDHYYEKDRAFFEDWYPGVWSGVTYFGRRYAVPNIGFASYSLWVNVDMFGQAGLAIPARDWTHQDFLESGRKLQRDSSGDGQIDQWIYAFNTSLSVWGPWFFNRGGSLTSPEDPEKITFGSDESIDALQWLQDLRFASNIIPPHQVISDNRTSFLEGRTAMANAGAWFWEEAKEVPFEKAVVLEPVGPTGRKMIITYWGWMISSQSQNPDLAWELIKYLTSEEMQIDTIKRRGTNVINRRAMQEYFGHDIPVQRFRETFLEYFNYPTEMLVPTVAPEAWRTIRSTVSSILNEGKPARIAVQEAVNAAQSQSTDFWEAVRAKYGSDQ